MLISRTKYELTSITREVQKRENESKEEERRKQFSTIEKAEEAQHQKTPIQAIKRAKIFAEKGYKDNIKYMMR